MDEIFLTVFLIIQGIYTCFFFKNQPHNKDIFSKVFFFPFVQEYSDTNFVPYLIKNFYYVTGDTRFRLKQEIQGLG